MEINTDRRLWELMFLDYEHIENESLQLKPHTLKVTVEDFSLSKVESLKFVQFLGMPFYRTPACHVAEYDEKPWQCTYSSYQKTEKSWLKTCLKTM